MVELATLVDKDLETRLLHNITPVLEAGYKHHMTSGPRNSVGLDETLEVGTLHPLTELYRAAGLPVQEVVTSELIEHIRDSYNDHVARLTKLGLDVGPVVLLSGAMNLGTEDNVSWYHAVQWKTFQTSESYLQILSRWTAEESDHGPLIEQWGAISGAIPSSIAHRNKVHQIMGGIGVLTDSAVGTNAFTDPQEADTVDAHRNLGLILDPVGRRVMNRLAGHEQRHNLLFRAIGEGIYKLDDEFVDYALPIEAEIHRSFAMPGEKSYPNFREHAAMIAVHGLFTLDGILKRQAERVEALSLLKLNPRSEGAKIAQANLAHYIDPNDRRNRARQRIVERLTDAYIKAEKQRGVVPFILGRTVQVSHGNLTVHPEAA